MLYTPKFCSECREKIERDKWGWFSSRRFCENCEIDFPLYKWIPVIWLGAGAILFLFGFGGYLKRAEAFKPPEMPLIVKNEVEPRSDPAEKSEKVEKTSKINIEETSPELPPNPVTLAGLSHKTEEISDNRQNPESEKVYFCGAQTKKGTPCTRRVRSGRCWQHRGQPAMPRPVE